MDRKSLRSSSLRVPKASSEGTKMVHGPGSDIRTPRKEEEPEDVTGKKSRGGEPREKPVAQVTQGPVKGAPAVRVRPEPEEDRGAEKLRDD